MAVFAREGRVVAAIALLFSVIALPSSAMAQSADTNASAPTADAAPPSGEEQKMLTLEEIEAIEATRKANAVPVIVEKKLPEMPPTPFLTQRGYPECREDYQQFLTPLEKAEATNRCTIELDNYYKQVLTEFSKVMNRFQDQLSNLYVQQVSTNRSYTQETRDLFYAEMIQRHNNADPEGASMKDYQLSVARYKADRAYMQDRFCFNSGCGGYPVPLYYTSPEGSLDQYGNPIAKKKKKSNRRRNCKRKKAGAGIFGSIIGAVGGKALGLGKVGSVLAGAFVGVLASEFACKLDKQEQVQAQQATYAVTEQAYVGAVSNWSSPTRGGVTGQSIVTALNAEPSGRTCLNITDVAIVEGEETRVSKRMCRQPGQKRYSVVA